MRGSVDVQVKAVFTLVLEVLEQFGQVIKPANSHIPQGLRFVTQIRNHLRTHWRIFDLEKNMHNQAILGVNLVILDLPHL